MNQPSDTSVSSLSAMSVESVDVDLVRRAHGLYGENSLSYWDSLVVAAAARSGCVRLLTEDFTAAEIAGVRIENPFRR